MSDWSLRIIVDLPWNLCISVLGSTKATTILSILYYIAILIMLGFFHHFFLSTIGKGCCTTSTPLPIALRTMVAAPWIVWKCGVCWSSSTRPSAVGELRLKSWDHFGVCEGLVEFMLTSHGTFCTGGAEYFAVDKMMGRHDKNPCCVSF